MPEKISGRQNFFKAHNKENPMDKEQEIKLQFLEEAQEYLNTMESGLLGLSSGDVNSNAIDAIFRGAHSLKGGAGMMGFNTLSHGAHRLEDLFKVLKAGQEKSFDGETEKLLLQSVDQLRYLVNLHKQGRQVPENWEASNLEPLVTLLQERIGEVDAQVEVAQFSQDTGQDMIKLLFETEVDGCLERLEKVLAQPDSPCLKEEFLLTAQEFASLGEMLELHAFTSLCQSVQNHLESSVEPLEVIAESSLQHWRRSQALILVDNKQALPTALSLSDEQEPATSSREEAIHLLSSIEATNLHKLEPSEETALPPLNARETDNTIRVSLQQIDQLGDLFGELTIERNGLDLQLKRLQYLMGLLKKRIKILDQSNFRLRSAYDSAMTGRELYEVTKKAVSVNFTRDFDSLEMDRYNEFHLISGEVMETIVQVQEITGDLELNLEDTERNARDINRTAKMMQNSLTKVRMRPLSDLLARFPRALREMSLQYGKAVELKVKGGSTLIDRSMLEKLNEPLLHLLRNAFDHGIEPPAVRRQLGKPEKGLIEISAIHRGNQTIITVSDDGGGIDLDKIRAKIKQLGISSDNLLRGNDRDLLNLIFEPGFTTTSEVTDLSGRGVGMDVVRTNLREIRGAIEVDTKPGRGATFTITVPFTLSVVRVLLVETQGMLLAFPSNSIEEIMLLHPEMVIQSAGQEVLNWEGYMIPLIRLHRYFQSPPNQGRLDTETIPLINQPVVLMIASGEDLVGMQVERYWGEQEVTIRQVEGNLKMPPGFSGCTILGDGRVVPLIDAITLLRYITDPTSMSSQNFLAEQLAATSAPEGQKATIMVVDDSINVRRFLALTLEKAGYRVEQAKDGQEALEKLRSVSVGLVICDIEMPRLDGYGFLSQVKASAESKKIPVIMLTSRSGDKHRQLALNLGASDYFSKPFKEQDLLQTIQKLALV